MKAALLLLLMSTASHAMECEGLAEGQVVRIDKGEGGLAKAAVQDQDGVGSCYANQSALLLQSVIPGNPNLSYLNLGLYYTNDKVLTEKRKSGDKRFTIDGKNADGTVAPERSSAIYGGFSCQTIEAALERQKKAGTGSVCKAEDVGLEHSFFDQTTGNNYDEWHAQERTLASASRYMNAYQQKFGYSFEKSETEEAKLAAQREEADNFSQALKSFVKNNADPFLQAKCTKIDNDKAVKILNNTLARALFDNPKCYDSKSYKIKTNLPECKPYDAAGFMWGNLKNPNTKVIYETTNATKVKIANSLPGAYKNPRDFNEFLNNLGKTVVPLDKNKRTLDKDKFLNNLVDHISPEDKADLEKEYNRIVLGKTDDCKSASLLEYFKDKNEFLKKAKADSALCKYGDLLERANDLAGALPSKTFSNMTGFVDFLTSKAGLNYDEALLSAIASDCSPDKRVMLPESLKCESKVISFEPADFPGNDLSSKAVNVIKENRAKLFDNLKNNRAIGIDICTKFWNDPSYDYHKEDASTKVNTCQNTGTHGFHAVTMVGYRCKNNRIQYLTQNSWGPKWKLIDKPYEIEEGKIWMDEDKLFKNMSSIDYLSL